MLQCFSYVSSSSTNLGLYILSTLLHLPSWVSLTTNDLEFITGYRIQLHCVQWVVDLVIRAVNGQHTKLWFLSLPVLLWLAYTFVLTLQLSLMCFFTLSLRVGWVVQTKKRSFFKAWGLLTIAKVKRDWKFLSQSSCARQFIPYFYGLSEPDVSTK